MPTPAELRARATARLNAINMAADRATPAVAQAVNDDANDYPWLHPDVRTALALANAPSTVKARVAQSAAQAAIANGAAYAADASRMAQAAKATADFQKEQFTKNMTDVVFGALRANGLNAKKFKWASADPLRATIRYGTAALNAPIEMLQTSIAAPLGAAAKNGAATPGGLAAVMASPTNAKKLIGDVASATKKAWWDDTFGAGSTTLATAMESPFGAQGTGYFMGAGVAAKAAQRTRDVRGTTEANHAWTLGRVAGAGLIQNRLVKDENSTAYNVVSGLADAGVAIWADPIQLSKAARAPIEVAEVTAKSRGFGRIGNAIMDARKMSRAEEIAKAGTLAREGEAAVKAGKAWEQAGARAEEIVNQITNAPTPSGGMEAAFTSNMLRQQEWVAQQSIDATEGWFKHAREIAMKAEKLGGVTDATIDAARRGIGSNIDYAETVRRAAGLVEDPKYGRQVAGSQTMRWLLSRDGQSVVEALTKETDATMVKALTKNRLPIRAAIEIAGAKTPEEVVQALARAVDTGGARTPQRITRMGTLRVQKAQESRLLGGMSKTSDAWFSLKDPEGAVEKMFNLLGTAGVTGEKRNGLVSDFMRALNTDNQGVVHFAVRGFQGQTDLRAEIKATQELIQGGTLAGEDLVNATKKLEQLMGAEAVVGKAGAIQQAILDSVNKDNWLDKKLHREDLKIMMKNASNEVGDVSKYTSDIVTDGNPAMLKYNHGPVRWTQLANDTVFMIDPRAVREIETEMDHLAPYLLGRNGTVRRMPFDMARGYQERIWRVPTILRPALAIRMLGEEAIRAMMGGGLRGTGDVISGFIRAGKTVDALGAAIDAPSLIERARKSIAELEKVAGNEARIAELQAEIDKAEEAIRSGKKLLDDARVGKHSREGQRAVFEQKLGADEDHMVRTGQWFPVNRKDPRELKRYRLAIGDELITMAADPVYKRLAFGGLLPGDGEATADGMADIERWLSQGAGRRYWHEVAANRNIDPTDMGELRAWIERQQRDLDYHFLNDPDAKKAIATGRIDGEELVAPDPWGRSPHGEKLRAWADKFAQADGSPDIVRYEATLRDQIRGAKGDPRLASAIEHYDRLTTAAFATMYSNRSDQLYRVPMFARRYMAHLEELIPKMAPEEAAKVADAIAANGKVALREGVDTSIFRKAIDAIGNGFADEKQIERIKVLAAGASGTGTADMADQLAKGWAIDDVKKLFFKADRDPRVVDKAKLLFPFARAFAEVGLTWGRIASQDPTGFVHATDKVLHGLRDAGVFHQDPNGQEVFTYPMSGPLSKLLTGVNAPMTGSVKSLNMIGSILPGVGPVASVPAYFIAQHTPLPQSAISLLFPYGEPKSIEDTAVPGWLAKIRSGWNQNEAEQVYGNTYFRTLQALLASGRYSNSPEDMRKLMEDAKGKARMLTTMRGIVQAVGPAAPMIQYMAETKQGDIAAAKLMQDYQRMIENPDEVRANGFENPEDYFISKYGESMTAYLVSRTVSNETGAVAADSFVDWRKNDGKHAWQNYPEVYGYIGPHPDSFSLNAFDQLVKSGDRTPRTSNDLVAEANNRIANARWRDHKRDQQKRVPNPTKAQQKKLDAEDQVFRGVLEDAFPGWVGKAELSRAEVKQKAAYLEQMAADPKLTGNATIEHLRSYYQNRSTALAAAQKKGAKTLDNKKAAGIKDWLITGAESMAANDPGFAAAWNDILSKEFN